VPLVAAAVCPHPPVLVPEVAAGAAGELAPLREACDRAVGVLRAAGAAGAARVVLVGGGPATRAYERPYRADFRPWGADVTATLGEPAADAPDADAPALPLSLAIGVWLLARTGAGRTPMWTAVTVAADTPPAECAALGARLVADGPCALLVLGDGSACRGVKAPGYDDPRAGPFDATVVRALAAADPDALLALDPGLAAELRVVGRAPWQVLAGAAGGGVFRGAVTYDAAPYGVQYVVASWTAA
jgi:hypothetical protein